MADMVAAAGPSGHADNPRPGRGIARGRRVAYACVVDTTITNNNAQERYEITADDELAGFAEYRLRPGLIAFIHTEIDERFEGHGLGGKLVGSALDDARSQGVHVLPFCPFVNAYIKGHPEYADLVPDTYREQFGL
jgi:predicted GNAT family acetyltransferase